MTNVSLDSELYTKLLKCRKAQLHSSVMEETSFSSYIQETLDVQMFAKQVMAKAPLSERTKALLRQVTVSNITTSRLFLKLRSITQSIGKTRDQDLQDAMANMSLTDSDECDSPSSSCKPHDAPAKLAPPTRKPSGKTYVRGRKSRAVRQALHRWALDHLHDLYPSSEAKRALASKECMSEKQVSGWFIQLRRKIGWNKIVKDHFQENGREAIFAAQSVFKQEKAEETVGVEVYKAFLSMKEKAEAYLLPVLSNEIEEHIDRLMSEVMKKVPGREKTSSVECPSSDIVKISTSATCADEVKLLRGSKRGMEEEIACASKRLKKSECPQSTDTVQYDRKVLPSNISKKRKRISEEGMIPPPTKKINIDTTPSASIASSFLNGDEPCSNTPTSSLTLTSSGLAGDNVVAPKERDSVDTAELNASLYPSIPPIIDLEASFDCYTWDQSSSDTPALSPSSTYTGLESYEQSTRPASPSTDQEYNSSVSVAADNQLDGSRLWTPPDLHLPLPKDISTAASELDQLWSEISLLPTITTGSFPEGDNEFVFSNYHNETATIDPALLFTRHDTNSLQLTDDIAETHSYQHGTINIDELFSSLENNSYF